MLHLEGFDFDLTAKNSDVPPVVLLHGSGGRETDWTDFAQHIAPRSTCFSAQSHGSKVSLSFDAIPIAA